MTTNLIKFREDFRTLNTQRKNSSSREEKEILKNKQKIMLSELTGISVDSESLEGIWKNWSRKI